MYLFIYIHISDGYSVESMSWKALAKAKLSSDGLFLEMPEPIYCLRNKEILMSILVSDDRKKVYSLILDTFSKGSDRILIMGTPGIGTF